MAEVDIIPKIRCDNCGVTVDKLRRDTDVPAVYQRPRIWGSMRAEGGRICQQTYGTGKERLDFTDLCPDCAEAALQASADALKARRSEGETGGVQ